MPKKIQLHSGALHLGFALVYNDIPALLLRFRGARIIGSWKNNDSNVFASVHGISLSVSILAAATVRKKRPGV